jgi:hypothetical protein
MAQDPDPRDEVAENGDGGEINDPLTQSDEEAPRKEFEPRKPE